MAPNKISKLEFVDIFLPISYTFKECNFFYDTIVSSLIFHDYFTDAEKGEGTRCLLLLPFVSGLALLQSVFQNNKGTRIMSRGVHKIFNQRGSVENR